MTTTLVRTAGLVLAALLAQFLAALPAAAATLTDAAGRTLYIFDKDSAAGSICYDACAADWPPYLGKVGDALQPDWTLLPRRDGALQWAYRGKPLYYFAGDKKAGDEMGNGRNGVWHTITD